MSKRTTVQRTRTPSKAKNRAAAKRSPRARKTAPSPRPPLPSLGGRVGADHIEVIARGVLLHGSRVLLCQSTKHGYLYLPGGHVEFAESAAAALAREFLEESGLRIRVGDLLMVDEGVFTTGKRTHHEVNLTFHVELVGKSEPPRTVRSREPGIALPWVELAAIVDLDVRPVAAKALLTGTRLLGAPASLQPPGSLGAEWCSAI